MDEYTKEINAKLMQVFEAEAEERQAKESANVACMFAAQLKHEIREMMEEHGVTGLELEYHKLSIRRTKPTALILNDKLIPTEYKVIESKEVINKKKLEEALQEGKSITGAVLSDKNDTLVIKAKGI
jgi:hypothetical protein